MTRSGGTRARLLEAATVLIGEVGWGRVTTRAVAARAGLPLGAVSYHFPGKQELLTQAALDAVQRVFETDEIAEAATLGDLLEATDRLLGSEDGHAQRMSAVLTETMREAGRDPALRQRMAALLGEYRSLLEDLVRTEQQRGGAPADLDPRAVATLIAAAGDGMLLHSLIDPEVDAAAAMQVLIRLLQGTKPEGHTPR